jgi:hypothetical protein
MTTGAGRDSAGRPHSLAPAHLGEARAGAALAVAVLGVAVFIAGVGIVVSGMTAATGYDPTNLPPNVNVVGAGQVTGGSALFVLGVALAGGALGMLAGSQRARIPTAILAVVAALAAVAGAGWIIVRGPSDLILALSLFGVGLGLGASGLLLLRPRR